MYQLYIEKYSNPVKKCIYGKIFKNEYNIAFHKPKKDICDKCYLHNKKESLTDSEEKVFLVHQTEKELCKTNRSVDRENADPNHGIVCYDLQKVFGLPKGNFLYIFHYS